MITRFYVDNYKCLQNFEYKPKKFELVVGANGTGKSTVFEAMDKVRRFVTTRTDARELFSSDCGTRWDSRSKQVFELDFDLRGGICRYRLEINLSSFDHRVEKETLLDPKGVVFETRWEKLPTLNTNFVQVEGEVENNYEFDDSDPFDDHAGEYRGVEWSWWDSLTPLSDSNYSAANLGLMTESPFLAPLASFHYLKINPQAIKSRLKRAEPFISQDLSNFASYYLFLLQQKQGRMFEMIPTLRDTIIGFDSFAVEEDFEQGRRELKVIFKQGNGKSKSRQDLKYSLDELSDGQRSLIALYTLLFCTLQQNTTLIIDEPENYIALRELQPWLMLLQERLEEHGGQVILISHHPEFINMMAPENAVVFERDNGGPVRIKRWEQGNSPLLPAELMARGWES
jgi:predicted ATPase